MKIIYLNILFVLAMLAQDEVTVRGRVISSDDGTPIVGASIVLIKTTRGVSTDLRGSFILKNIPQNRKALQISAVGYKNTTIELSGANEVELIIHLEPSLIQTPTVVVTASKRPQSLEEIPVSMSIIDAKMFERKNIIALDDALRYVPGVNFQQSQINIRASTGYSRGAGSRVTLLMDGMPLLTGDTGEITFESIPVFQIDRVEVVKGAGSTLYGSGALGGVVNVLTKDFSEKQTNWWRVFGGIYSQPSFDQWKWSTKNRYMHGQMFGFSSKFGNFGISVSLQEFTNDGYREQDWLRRYDGFIKLGYNFSAKQSITILSNMFQQYRGDFLWWNGLKDALRPADAQRNVRVSSLRFNNSLIYKNFISEEFYLELKAVHFRGNWFRDSMKNVSYKRLDESISDAFVIDVQGNVTLNEENLFVMGLTWNAERVRANIFGIHDGHGGAVYFQDEYKFSKDIAATLGLRQDIQQIVGLPLHQQLSPKIGLRYNINEKNIIRASAGRGFRSPSIGEVYTSTSNTGSVAIVVPNTSIQPENGWTYEMGITSTLTDNIQFDGALFKSDFENLIEPYVDRAGDSIVVNFRNITHAEIKGFETILHTKWFDRFLFVDAHYNYNWAIDKNTNTFLRFRPRHIAGVNAECAPNEILEIGFDYRFMSRIETIDEKLVDLAQIKSGRQRVDVHVADVHVGYNFSSIDVPIQVTMNVNNILGYNYNELIGNVSPPRNYVLSIEGVF